MSVRHYQGACRNLFFCLDTDCQCFRVHRAWRVKASASAHRHLVDITKSSKSARDLSSERWPHFIVVFNGETAFCCIFKKNNFLAEVFELEFTSYFTILQLLASKWMFDLTRLSLLSLFFFSRWPVKERRK